MAESKAPNYRGVVGRVMQLPLTVLVCGSEEGHILPPRQFVSSDRERPLDLDFLLRALVVAFVVPVRSAAIRW